VPAQPNLGRIARIVYLAAGLLLMAWGLFYTESSLAHYGLPIAGAIVFIEGAIGYCQVVAVLGLGSKK